MNKQNRIVMVVAITLMAIGFIFGCICVFWSIYAFVKYGSKPITEVPAWALRFMLNKG